MISKLYDVVSITLFKISASEVSTYYWLIHALTIPSYLPYSYIPDDSSAASIPQRQTRRQRTISPPHSLDKSLIIRPRVV